MDDESDAATLAVLRLDARDFRAKAEELSRDAFAENPHKGSPHDLFKTAR